VLPADIVLAPAWYFHNAGITFDEDFFFNPDKRVEAERTMEQVLHEKWGRFGLGRDRDRDIPQVGAVHLAAGFLISEMLGCKVEYKVDAPPQVLPANRDSLELNPEDAFRSSAFKKFEDLTEKLSEKYGYLKGDVNWGGILNLALDLRGEAIFMDIFDRPDEVKAFFGGIETVIERFVDFIERRTGSSSISVNRNVRHICPAVYLHSECSHTMISHEDYEKFLLDADVRWSRRHRPFGVHYCGPDAHKKAGTFAKIPHLDFLDVGWGGDVKELREHLPKTFLNIRLSPVEIIDRSTDEIHLTIRRLVNDSDNPYLTGVCCINMDEKVRDEKITAIFETVEELRKEYESA